MKILPKELKVDGFKLRQIHREGDFAIYKKTKEDENVALEFSAGFEAIRIRSHNGYTIAGNYCPPAEVYCPNSKWGSDGYTCSTKEEAYARLDKMMSKQNLPSEIRADDGSVTVKDFKAVAKKKRGRPKGSKNKN